MSTKQLTIEHVKDAMKIAVLAAVEKIARDQGYPLSLATGMDRDAWEHWIDDSLCGRRVSGEPLAEHVRSLEAKQ